MKALAALLLSLSLPNSQSLPLLRKPVQRTVVSPARKGGRWYLADNGHAVYCYGPVKLLPQPEGGFLRVATFCQGENPIVPLRD
jgi:hypothetical protein